MRSLLLLCLFLCLCFVGFSQKPLSGDAVSNTAITIKPEQKQHDGQELLFETSIPESENILYRGNQNIGESTYDLQTNATQQNRLLNLGDETVLSCWTKGENNFQTGWPQRGTGYNQSVNSAWGPNPTGRIEANDRTGWPNVAYTGSGDVVVVAHLFNDPVFSLHMSKKGLTDDLWVESEIPSKLTEGTSWPRMVAGGPDGNSLHVISVYRGPELDSVTNQLVYYRSIDGGDNWDVQDFVIPGLDSSIFRTFPVDQYAIDAQDNIVAVTVFSDFGDLLMAKSEDNGDTWAIRTVNDFPIDKYVLDGGIDTTLLPDYPDAPVSTAVYSSDGTGDVKIDANGKVHIVYGRMYLTDDDLTDAAWQYYPYTDGIAYWNEDSEDNSYEIIASTPDLNGNDTLDLSNWGGTYFTAISSQPSLGFDDEGNIFCLYSAVNELLTASSSGLNYRHAYLVTSQDGGATWDEEPLDVLEQDEDILEFIEGGAEFYYPQLAKKVDHKAHIVVHADGEPGIYVNSLLGGNSDDTQGLTPNLVWYLGQTNILSEVTETNLLEKTIQVFPNPAQDQVFLKLDLEKDRLVNASLMNAQGMLVHNVTNVYPAGSTYVEFNVQALTPGIYFIKLNLDQGNAITKSIIIE